MKISRLLPFVLVISMLASGSLAAQQTPPPFKDDAKIPDTPACKRAIEVIALVNGGDVEKARAPTIRRARPRTP